MDEIKRMQELAGLNEIKVVVPNEPLFYVYDKEGMEEPLGPFTLEQANNERRKLGITGYDIMDEKTAREVYELNEIRVTDPTNPLYLAFLETKELYDELIGTNPIYNGLDQVLNDPKLFSNVMENVNDIMDDNDYEDEEERAESEPGYVVDFTDRVIMSEFASQLVRNLLDLGFTYDSDEDTWTVPQQYQDGGRNNLTSYGIIWDVWGVDYDTNVREGIGDILRDAAEELE